MLTTSISAVAAAVIWPSYPAIAKERCAHPKEYLHGRADVRRRPCNCVDHWRGRLLGAGEKDVAVPFAAVKHTMKNQKIYLTMDTTKDALKGAPGFKYDREKTSWIPENQTTGQGAR